MRKIKYLSQNIPCATYYNKKPLKKTLSPLKQRVHFIGIGGIGISALARYFLSQGYFVSGSDIFSSDITNELKKDGINIYIGHKHKNISKFNELVIYSAAISKDNIELKTALNFKIPVKSYAEALGELTKKYKTVAVSGTCGKSTTTAMLSLVFIKAGFNPTVIIGTKLKEFNLSNNIGTNFRKGKSDYLIIEADEHFKSFLNYSPFTAIITNIDRDHLDFYKNLNNLKNTFLNFIKNINFGGILVVNKDDKNLFSLNNKINKIADKNNLKVFWYSLNDKKLVNVLHSLLKVPGKHNISNAMAVYTMAKAFNINNNDIFNALGKYKGAWRRMEYRGKFKIQNSKLKIPVYDDYAHHPSKIKAALSGFREKYPKSNIICVFQPHQIQRLKYLFKEFTNSFDNADNLILLDIFKVKGRDESLSDVNSEKLAEAIKNLSADRHKKKSSPVVLYLKNSNNLKKEINNLIQKSKIKNQKFIIIMMGAGDIYKMSDKLIK